MASLASILENYLDKTGTLYVVGKLKELIAGKVDKADGKGLSTNDYTTAEKTKLSGIETGAQVNVQPDWNATSGGAVIKNKPASLPASNTTSSYAADGTAPVNGKAVAAALGTLDAADTAVPGHYVSEVSEADGKIAVKRAALPTKLPASDTTSTYSATGTAPVNGKAVASAISGKANKSNTLSGYGITDAPTKTEMAAAIAAAIAGFTGISFSLVESLPETGKEGVIYLIPHAHGTGDSHDEYIWLKELKTFEKIGSTDVDLSGYVKKSELVPISNEEIDAMFT